MIENTKTGKGEKRPCLRERKEKGKKVYMYIRKASKNGNRSPLAHYG